MNDEIRSKICSADKVSEVFEGSIRNGAWGDFSKERYKVLQCDTNEIAFLDPFPSIDYTTGEYRELVNKSSEIETYLGEHDRLQPAHLNLIRGLLERGNSIADCGCGGGSLLDFLSGMAGKTVAIEPLSEFHDSLRSRGHAPYKSIKSAISEGQEETIDLALSFHVIEHTEDPIDYLEDIYRLLKPGGKAYVHTPNLNDILMKVAFDKFAPFNFRTQHNYYFTEKSLCWMSEKAGFSVEKITFHQEFSMSNMMYWLKEGAPRGSERMTGISEQADSLWKSYCESTGQATNVGITIVKPSVS